MNDENPYRSPQTRITPEGASSDDVTERSEAIGEAVAWPWRWRDYVILPNECALPPRCVLCGAPTDHPLRPEKISWTNPVHRVVLGSGIAGLASKEGVLFYALCAEHDRRWDVKTWVYFGAGAAGVIQFLLGIYLTATLHTVWPLFLLLSAFFSVLLPVLLLSAVPGKLVVHRIENGVVWLRLPKSFYVNLPELPSVDGRTPIIPRFELTDG